jgi:chromosome segregation ATPase
MSAEPGAGGEYEEGGGTPDGALDGSLADMRAQLRALRIDSLGEARKVLAQSAQTRVESLVRFKDGQISELRATLRSALYRSEMAEEKVNATSERIAAVEADAAERDAVAAGRIADLEGKLATRVVAEREALGRVQVLEISSSRMSTGMAELGEQVRALLSAKDSLEDALENAQDDIGKTSARASRAEADAASSTRRFALAFARKESTKADLDEANAQLGRLQWEFSEYRFDAEKGSRARLAREAQLATAPQHLSRTSPLLRNRVANVLRAALYRVTPGPVRRALKLAPRTQPSADDDLQAADEAAPRASS